MRHRALAPPLAWQIYLLCFITGLFAAFQTIPAIIALGLLLFFSVKPATPARLAFAILIFTAGACASLFYFEAASPPALPGGSNGARSRLCGTVQTAQTLPEKRLRIILKGLEANSGGRLETLPGECAWTWENGPLQPPLRGQRICVTASLKHEGGFARNSSVKTPTPTPDALWRIWTDGQKGDPEIMGEPGWLQRLRQKIFLKTINLLQPDANPALPPPRLSQGQAITVAILFGDRRFLSGQTVNLFGEGSIAHSLALSGQHLGIAGLLGFMAAFLIGKYFPGAFLWRPRFIIAAILGLAPALLYLWIGGAPPSLARAFGMLAFFALLSYRGRIFSLMDLLLLALLMILALDTTAIYNVGLQLSVLCIAVIFLAAPTLARTGHALFPAPLSGKKKLLKWLAQIFLLSFAIQLALLPMTLGRFQQTGAWFPLNLLWLPVLGFFVLPLAFLGLLLAIPDLASSSWLAREFLNLAAMPCGWLLELLEFLNQKGAFNLPLFISPHWTVYIAFALALAGCGLIWSLPRNQRKSPAALKVIAASLAFLAIAPALRIYHYLDDELTIEALDVGQAQSLRIKFPQNGDIIVDGGGSRSTRFDPGKTIIAPILTNNHKPVLSTIVSSHPDLDHAGGLVYLEDKFMPRQFFHNGRPANAGLEDKWNEVMTAKNAVVLTEGDELVLGPPENGLRLEVLHPPRDGKRNWEGNSASIVMRLVKNGEGVALFTGDAERGVLKHLVESGKDLRAKILFAPHHGSDRSLYAPFYNRVNPEIVIASCGFENRWNYPGKKLRKFLETKRIPLLDTGTSGKITLNLEDRLAIDTAEKGAVTLDRQGKIQ